MRRRPGHSVGIATPATLPGPAHLAPAVGGVRFRLPTLVWFSRRRERVPALDEPTVRQPRGRRSDIPADVVFVTDDSGSTQTTDPSGYRYVAQRRITNLLVRGVGGPTIDDR